MTTSGTCKHGDLSFIVTNLLMLRRLVVAEVARSLLGHRRRVLERTGSLPGIRLPTIAVARVPGSAPGARTAIGPTFSDAFPRRRCGQSAGIGRPQPAGGVQTTLPSSRLNLLKKSHDSWDPFGARGSPWTVVFPEGPGQVWPMP